MSSDEIIINQFLSQNDLLFSNRPFQIFPTHTQSKSRHAKFTHRSTIVLQSVVNSSPKRTKSVRCGVHQRRAPLGKLRKDNRPGPCCCTVCSCSHSLTARYTHHCTIRGGTVEKGLVKFQSLLEVT